MNKAHLLLVVDQDGKAKFNYSGDMALMARSIIRLARHDEEFAIALNTGMITLQAEMEAIKLRDEMIGFINNQE